MINILQIITDSLVIVITIFLNSLCKYTWSLFSD